MPHTLMSVHGVVGTTGRELSAAPTARTWVLERGPAFSTVWPVVSRVMDLAASAFGDGGDLSAEVTRTAMAERMSALGDQPDVLAAFQAATDGRAALALELRDADGSVIGSGMALSISAFPPEVPGIPADAVEAMLGSFEQFGFSGPPPYYVVSVTTS